MKQFRKAILGDLGRWGWYTAVVENPYEQRESQLLQLDRRSRELLLRGEFEVGEEVANEFLAIAKDASDRWHSLARFRLGTILENAGRYEEAERHARAAQSVVASDSYAWLAAAGLLANIYLNQGNYAAAKTLFLDTLDVIPDSSFAFCGLSSVESSSDNPDDARQYALKGLEAARRGDEREHMSVAHNLLGDIERDAGDLTKAEKHFRNALAISEELSRRRGISIACDRLSEIECDRENYVLGLEYGQRVVAAETEMGRMHEVVDASFRVAYRLENADLPEVLFAGITICQTAFREATKPMDRFWALRQQARFQTKLEQYDQAEASLKQAMQYLDESDREMAQTCDLLGWVQRKRKRFAAARKSCTRSLQLAQKYQHVSVERRAQGSLAWCAIDEGDSSRARYHWQLALKIAEREEDQAAVADLRETLDLFEPKLVSRIRYWLLGRWRR